jgi:hypothetical protein
LILALKRAIETTFDDNDWKELGYATDTIEWIDDHDRLLRSLRWGDDDYGGHVFDALEHVLEKSAMNIQVLLELKGIEQWIRDNAPEVHQDYYGNNVPAVDSIADVEKGALGFDVDDHIRRIRASIIDDPALAIGSTKELLETVFKEVLGLHGARIGSADMQKLWKRVQTTLQLDPKDVKTAVPGGDSLRRLLGSLNQIVVAVTELRNLYGTGHGKSKAPALDPESAQLVVGAGTALAAYVMARYKQLGEPKSRAS